LHFFVFESTAIAIHVGLLAATAIIAALYPMRVRLEPSDRGDAP
jgi:hypothetical protein